MKNRVSKPVHLTRGTAWTLSPSAVRPVVSHQLWVNQAAQRFALTCPLSLPGPGLCPFGGICHACPPRTQAKLKISQPGDRYEKEANRIADLVMRTPEPRMRRQSESEETVIQPKPQAPQITPLIQRQVGPEEEEEEIQTKAVPGGITVLAPRIQAQINALRGGGQPLSASARAFFEPLFGYDFSGVRIHTDTQAAETARTLNAQAFTIGRDVVFGSGQYVPWTINGKRLLAHELTHVIQNDGKIRRQPAQPRRRDPEVESPQEVQWSRQSMGGIWGPEQLSIAKARRRWRICEATEDMRADVAFGWLLCNFEVGSANLNSTKKFHMFLSQITAQARSYLRWNIGGLPLYSKAYIGILGRHSKSGKADSNRALAFDRAYNVWNWLQRALPPDSRITYLTTKGIYEETLPALIFSGSIIPQWARRQRSVLVRAVNRSVEVILFLQESRPRRDWRQVSKQRLRDAPHEIGVFGNWILNNWEFFMNPSRSGYAWAPGQPGGDRYGLFFRPPHESEFVSRYIREVRPDKSVAYFTRLYSFLVEDLNNLAGLITIRPLNECNNYTCLPPSLGDRNIALKVKCRVRYCRYKGLQSDASSGPRPTYVWKIKWGDTVCKWCYAGSPFFPSTVPCGGEPSPCEIIWR